MNIEESCRVTTIYGRMPPNQTDAGANARITKAAMPIRIALFVASSGRRVFRYWDLEGLMRSCHLRPNQSKSGIVNPYTA
jgi:hypothetical protein